WGRNRSRWRAGLGLQGSGKRVLAKRTEITFAIIMDIVLLWMRVDWRLHRRTLRNLSCVPRLDGFAFVAITSGRGTQSPRIGCRSASARGPSTGAVPGRWGACLAVRTPPAAWLQDVDAARAQDGVVGGVERAEGLQAFLAQDQASESVHA